MQATAFAQEPLGLGVAPGSLYYDYLQTMPLFSEMELELRWDENLEDEERALCHFEVKKVARAAPGDCTGDKRKGLPTWEASVISVASSPCVDLFGPTGASRGHAFWRTRHGDRCARGKPGLGAHGPRTKYVLVAIGLRGAAWEASVISVQHFCNTCPQRSASSGGSRSLERGRGASGRGASSGSC